MGIGKLSCPNFYRSTARILILCSGFFICRQLQTRTPALKWTCFKWVGPTRFCALWWPPEYSNVFVADFPDFLAGRMPNYDRRDEEALLLAALVEYKCHKQDVAKRWVQPTLTGAEKKKAWKDISKLECVTDLLHLLTIWLWEEVLKYSLQKLCWNSCLYVKHTGMLRMFLCVWSRFLLLERMTRIKLKVEQIIRWHVRLISFLFVCLHPLLLR